MKIVESDFLDEANEKILSELDEVFGVESCKDVLRQIINFSKIISECKIEFCNFNIIINNNSAYNSYQKLIEVIIKIYKENKIIENASFYEILLDDIRLSRMGSNKITEDVIIVNACNCRRTLIDVRKNIEEFMGVNSNKIFIFIDDIEKGYFSSSIKQAYTEIAMWSMNIEKISLEEKIRYCRRFFENHKIKYQEKWLESIADRSFYELKNKLLELLVYCKLNSSNKLTDEMLIKKNVEIVKENTDKTLVSGYKLLDNMIGLEDVKIQLTKLINYIKVNKRRKNMPMLHMCFTGNPGTGKTTIARIVGKIFSEEKILSNRENFVEVRKTRFNRKICWAYSS